jgi:predicted aspartyl protease
MKRNSLWVAIIALIVCASADAQETRGKILGTVQDPQGGLVPGAALKITNVDTQTSVQLVTNEQGYFEASLLNPGNYSEESRHQYRPGQ